MITLKELMDDFFVRIGFKRRELNVSHYRGHLYVGVIYMFGLASAFLIMAALG